MKCRVLVADPPWKLRDQLPGPGRGAGKHYRVLSTYEIMAFPLPNFAEDAILFLWKLASMPEDALMVARAWGFTPKSEIVWVKQTKNGKRHFGMGRTVRAEHETCIVATSGRPQVACKSVRSVFTAPIGRHSEKPDEFFGLVEKLCGKPKRESHWELFARRTRPGWRCVGDELQGADDGSGSEATFRA